MNYNEEVNNYDVNFEGIEEGYFLVGLLSAFNNLYQTTADAAIKEISWKQMFSLICINMCKVAPSINELADIMESSHQNVKQILLKLEKKGFIYFETDEKDKRKQRIYIADRAEKFFEELGDTGNRFMSSIVADIPTEQLQVTIKTIAHMEQNLKKMRGKKNESISDIQE